MDIHARCQLPDGNGTAVTCARDQTPTSHADVSTSHDSQLEDVGPPQLRSRVKDTITLTAQRCACGMPDSDSRCRVADGVVESGRLSGLSIRP